jgi:hypothetical protein
MAADMSELLPQAPLVMPLTNHQRRSAAISLAERHPSRHRLAYFLVQLGLAQHEEDGTFTSTRDREDVSWFSRDQVATLPFRLPAGALDDCR